MGIRWGINRTLIVVSHDMEFAKRADRVITIVDGEIVNA
jgi:ABC-type lipoprotein export system ATPase subunit